MLVRLVVSYGLGRILVMRGSQAPAVLLDIAELEDLLPLEVSGDCFRVEFTTHKLTALGSYGSI